jgi:hypothetical protein
MIYLTYNLHLTPHARNNVDEFWNWVEEREPWFYDGLDMVQDTRWLDFGSEVQHLVVLTDEEALTSYREAIAEKGRDPAWESRRTSQDLWYSIPGGSRIAADPPVRLGLKAP